MILRPALPLSFARKVKIFERVEKPGIMIAEN